MPSQQEIRWSQLRVGVLVAVALIILVVLIFLMTGSTGGLFTRKINLRCYFENAAGLKVGAPVTLQGVPKGNVKSVKVVPDHKPNMVEVVVTVNDSDIAQLHTDTKASIKSAGVLGDSFLDLDSLHATGPPPKNNAELLPGDAPSIDQVISNSNESIKHIDALIGELQTTVKTINDQKGTIGKLIGDRALAAKLDHITSDLESISSSINNGKGTLGKLVNDDTLYNRANDAVTHIDNIAANLDSTKGTAGKLIHDPTLYNNLNSAIENTNHILKEIRDGNGVAGKLTHDPEFARKLDDSITHLDSLLKQVDEGQGSVGQLFKNRSLYDHADQTMDQASQLINGMRTNPKKYLNIQLKMF